MGTNIETLTTNSLCIAKRLLHVLDVFGMDALMTGGFPRDLLHNKYPKDLDIVVTGLHKLNPDELEGLFANLRAVVISSFGQYARYDNTASLTNSTDFESGKVTSVYKILETPNLTNELRFIPIDLIFYGESYTDASQCVADFDTNFNQYVMSGGTPKYVGKEETQFQFELLRDDVRLHRVNYIKEKAKYYGWKTGE